MSPARPPAVPLLLTLRLFLSSAILISLASVRPALAQSKPLSPPLLAPQKTSLWRNEWPQFRVSEGVATLAAGVASAAIVIAGPIEQPRWQGPILFDDAVRNGLRASSPEARSTYRTIGDWTYRLSPILPLVDVVFVSAIGHHDSKLALNLGGLFVEAYSYSGLLSFVSTQLSARKRPYSECQEGGECDTQSFYSGHSAIAATGAGLMCANHTRIALYGNPILDIGSCILLSANALLTATTRVVADRHYATDVIVGTSFGFALGYAVPVLLHYSYGPNKDRTIAFAPDPSCGGNCLAVRGVF
ncbi:MAG TPA: phosphatase PAP2 family protein [Polyangiaceae bacterium]|nr:phosphatase PAP2 family protein [Polyangiaceae bacterium]